MNIKSIFIYSLGLIAALGLTACGADGGDDSAPAVQNEGGNGGSGQGGSLARFTVAGNYLYTLDLSTLKVYDLSDPYNMKLVNTTEVGSGMETVFPYGDYLYFGSTTGMHIYNISDPANPVKESEYQHIRSCDPVVVQGDYAYVTLRNNTRCGGWNSRLEVVNVSDPTAPFLEREYSLSDPYGLGIDGDRLFICDGSAGLRVYDVTNGTEVTQIDRFGGINAFDVIPNRDREGHLILIAEEGLYQYEYTPEDMRLLSLIETEPQ